MSFIGLKKAEDRTALIAYLRTLGNHPVPTQGEIDAEAKELAPPAEATPADAAAPAKDAPKAH
jgi:cytochrome c